MDYAFEFIQKLGLEYFCFHDRDVAPEGNTLRETNQNLDKVVDRIEQRMRETGVKLLWNTSNMFTNPRFVSGAATSPFADIFAYSGAQIKHSLEITKRLGAENYVFWGGREGYENLWNTNLHREQEQQAMFFRMAVDYAKEIGLDAQFLIEPKPQEPTTHQYDYDAASTIAFLQTFDLKDHFKLNLEGNHANLAGHTFQHELRVAREAGMFGSIDASQGDKLIGWDIDEFPSDMYETIAVMWEVLSNGGIGKSGGLNFDAKPRRTSFSEEDLFLAHIVGIDSFAAGLIVAAKLRSDKVIEKVVERRYESFSHGIGADIESGAPSLTDLETYCLDKSQQDLISATRPDHMETIKANVNNYIVSALAEA